MFSTLVAGLLSGFGSISGLFGIHVAVVVVVAVGFAAGLTSVLLYGFVAVAVVVVVGLVTGLFSGLLYGLAGIHVVVVVLAVGLAGLTSGLVDGLEGAIGLFYGLPEIGTVIGVVGFSYALVYELDVLEVSIGAVGVVGIGVVVDLLSELGGVFSGVDAVVLFV